ncbi:MAG: LysR family transcriptional regulator [Magnetospirillum sp.]|nr:LysR family transcriptional regulator [Magnetospirillum sp.]
MAAPIKLRLQLCAPAAFGPGKADLLEAIERHGSISGAARSLEMSYRRAWLLVDETNRAFRSPLVDASFGGSGGGGARLTDLGRQVVATYREMQAKAAVILAPEMAEIAELLAPCDDGGGGERGCHPDPRKHQD